MNSFTNQVAIITGAASGIGLSIAHKLLAMDAQVILFDMNEDNLHAEFDKYGDKAHVVAVNVTDEQHVLFPSKSTGTSYRGFCVHTARI